MTDCLETKIVEYSSPASSVQWEEDEESFDSRTPSPLPLPKILSRITVTRNETLLPNPKPASLDLNVSLSDFKYYLNHLVLNKLDITDDLISDPKINYYITWKTKAYVDQKKNKLLMSDYIHLQDEDDYEALIQDIRSCQFNKKKPLSDMILCIVAKAKIDECELMDNEAIRDGTMPIWQTPGDGIKRKVCSRKPQSLILYIVCNGESTNQVVGYNGRQSL